MELETLMTSDEERVRYLNTLPARKPVEPCHTCRKPTPLSELQAHMGCLCACCFKRDIVPTL